MAKRVHYHPDLIFSVGTQVVTLKEIIGQNGRTLHPRGSVGVVVKSPSDMEHSYRVRFPDGVEESLKSSELTTLAKFKEGKWRLYDVVTGDESWFFHRKIGSKQSNASWVAEGQSPRTVVKRHQFEPKTMFSIYSWRVA